MTDRRRLIVMRHAKAEPFASSDHARRLTDRGVRDARAAGLHLREKGLVPDTALVSSAVRTQQTWSAVQESLPEDAVLDVRVEDELFAASFDTLVDALCAVPEERRTVLVVGHNPTAAYLCHFLDDGEGDTEAVSGLLKGFPPAALAVFETTVPWAGLEAETGRLVDFHVGQG